MRLRFLAASVLLAALSLAAAPTWARSGTRFLDVNGVALTVIGPRCIFSDVCPGDYFYEPVGQLVGQGAISGYADGTFRPYANTTRGQLAKIIVLAADWPLDTRDGPHFYDVAASNPFYGYIETAYNRGIISGYADATFRWGDSVTRGQLAKIVVLAEGWTLLDLHQPTFLDVPRGSTFYRYIETAALKQVIRGYNVPGGREFRWYNNATRGQIAKIVYEAVSAP